MRKLSFCHFFFENFEKCEQVENNVLTNKSMHKVERSPVSGNRSGKILKWTRSKGVKEKKKKKSHFYYMVNTVVCQSGSSSNQTYENERILILPETLITKDGQMGGNLQRGDLKEMSNFKVCPMQLTRPWI